ncbi:MAG: hypothetical protein LBF57_00820 [Holosporaceae bacterium]|jgi:hypothetical protein|nr:hypothetical protein [Holosporaceae bacterium]
MKLIFDWSHSFYEEKNEWRGDEEIISLEIFQKECGFATAKVIIGIKDSKKLLDKKYAKIGAKIGNSVAIIFSGRLIAFPIGIENSVTELEFIAEPSDHSKKLSEFSGACFKQYQAIDKHQEEKHQIIFDDLFFSSDDFKNPTVFLEGDSKIFFWNMRNGSLSLSDINRGEKNFDIIGDEILKDSVKVRIAREPYKKINLKISASWIQHEYGVVDLFPMIAEKFDYRLVNSFTNIRTGIEKLCNFSEKSGYRLVHCSVNEINPNTFSQIYPLTSPEIKRSSDKKVFLKRFYFNGKLVIGWTYKQKRTEIVNVNVLNNSSSHGREKNLYLRLRAIQLPKQYPLWNHFTYYSYGDLVRYRDKIFECNSSHVSSIDFDSKEWKEFKKIPDALPDETASSFFATQRGKNAIKYALQKAISLVNYSSRYIEIDFCVEAKKFISVTLNDQITIRNNGFANGYIVGKVIKIRFTATADQKIIKFTIGCRSADLSGNFAKLNSYVIEIADDESRVQPADIVKNIEIKNSPEEQIELMHQSFDKTLEELKKHATKIKLSLHPLSTTRSIIREINLPNFEMEQL